MPALHVLFGQVVRRLRLEAGYSQESFADAIGVHRNYIGTVERGETNITLENIGRIAKGLKQPIWVLLREIEIPSATPTADAVPGRLPRDGPATAWSSGQAARVAERRLEVRAQVAELLTELNSLDEFGGKAVRVRPPRARKGKK